MVDQANFIGGVGHAADEQSWDTEKFSGLSNHAQPQCQRRAKEWDDWDNN
jgi:hypothetical protein